MHWMQKKLIFVPESYDANTYYLSLITNRDYEEKGHLRRLWIYL